MLRTLMFFSQYLFIVGLVKNRNQGRTSLAAKTYLLLLCYSMYNLVYRSLVLNLAKGSLDRLYKKLLSIGS